MATQYAQTTDLDLVMNPASSAGLTTQQKNAALLAASELFDSRARQHFTLPLLTWGQDVIDFVCAIAAYRLMRLRGYNPAQGGDPAIKEGYDYGIGWVDKVASGAVTPDVVDSSPGGVVGGASVVTSQQRGWSNRGNANDGGGPFDGDPSGSGSGPWPGW